MTDLGKRWNLLISIGTRLHFSVRGVEGGGTGRGIRHPLLPEKNLYVL